MNLKSLIVSAAMAIASAASAQWYGGGYVGVGGYYNNTVVNSNYGATSIVTTTVGSGVGYYGGYGYYRGYYGGCATPAVMPYYGYAPAYPP